jgi:hypothetical protein
MDMDERVCYIGSFKDGVPYGRKGTLVEIFEDGYTGMVRWDIDPNVDCQVTHSGVALSDIERIQEIELATAALIEVQSFYLSTYGWTKYEDKWYPYIQIGSVKPESEHAMSTEDAVKLQREYLKTFM